MLARLDEDGSLALDWRLNVMQSLLLESSTDLAARQARAEDLVRIACMRWRYRDEYVALRALEQNRTCERLFCGTLLAVMPASSSVSSLAASSLSNRRSSFGEVHRAAQLLSSAEALRQQLCLRRGMRGFQSRRQAALAAGASNPAPAPRRAFELESMLRLLRRVMRRWLRGAAEVTVLEAAAHTLLCYHCRPAFSWLRRWAARVRAEHRTSASSRRSKQMRLLGMPCWRRWSRGALLPLREVRLTYAIITWRLSERWRIWTGEVVAARCRSLAIVHAHTRQARHALIGWREVAAAKSASDSAIDSAHQRVSRRTHRRALSAAMATWWGEAGVRRALASIETDVSARRAARLQRLGLASLLEAVTLDARLLAAWGRLMNSSSSSNNNNNHHNDPAEGSVNTGDRRMPADGCVASRATPSLLALWRRWLRRWQRARDAVGRYIELLCLVGRGSVQRALHGWRRDAEAASFFALRQELACRSLATRRFVHRLRSWCARVRGDRLQRAIDTQQRVAAVVRRVRELWCRWTVHARRDAVLTSACELSDERLCSRIRDAQAAALSVLREYAYAGREVLLAWAGRSLLWAVRRWAAHANSDSHYQMRSVTARSRGRSKVLYETLRVWCIMHGLMARTLSRVASKEFELRGAMRLRRVTDGLHLWRDVVCWERAGLAATAAALRRWCRHTAALEELASRSGFVAMLARSHHRAISCARALSIWAEPLRRRNARASAFVSIAAVRRRREQAAAFGAWRYAADFHNAYIITVHRGRRMRRERVIAVWRAVSARRATLSAILRKSAVPRWRRRCVSALRYWLAEATERIQEADACRRCRLSHALRTFFVLCGEVAYIRGRLSIGRALTAHRLVSSTICSWHAIASVLAVVRTLAAAAGAHFEHLAWHRWREAVAEASKRDVVERKLKRSAMARHLASTRRRVIEVWQERAEEWRGVVRPSQLLSLVVSSASHAHPSSVPTPAAQTQAPLFLCLPLLMPSPLPFSSLSNGFCRGRPFAHSICYI